MVILHRGFGGQNLGVKFGKFKKADLHHGLRGFWGDLLALDGIIGKQATAFIKANNDITKRINRDAKNMGLNINFGDGGNETTVSDHSSEKEITLRHIKLEKESGDISDHVIKEEMQRKNN